jgi:hypothetical protein
MDRDELLKLIEVGDAYGLMLAAVRGWVEKHHPEVDRAAVYAYCGEDLLSMRIRIPVSAVDPEPVLAR